MMDFVLVSVTVFPGYVIPASEQTMARPAGVYMTGHAELSTHTYEYTYRNYMYTFGSS